MKELFVHASVPGLYWLCDALIDSKGGVLPAPNLFVLGHWFIRAGQPDTWL